MARETTVPPLPPFTVPAVPGWKEPERTKGLNPAVRGTGLCHCQQGTLTWFHWHKQLLLLPHTGPGMDIHAAQLAPETSIRNLS